MFKHVQRGPPDPMFTLKTLADNDLSPKKVDLGIGVYRNEEAQYHELRAIKAYEITTGDSSFVKNASHVIFGKQSELVCSQRVTSVQTISGTGANHLAALFLSRCPAFKGKQVHIGTPAWGNYEPLFGPVGFEVVKYRHYDPQKTAVDFPALLDTVTKAPPHSVFWHALAQAMKKSQLFPFFDIAYQGLGISMEDDAYGIRLFAEMGFELVACQSFSKNFGIYGERCGVLHVVSENAEIASNIYDQLRCLIRWEFSSSPAYGSRLVNTVLTDTRLIELWLDELAVMRKRLVDNRQRLYHALVNERKVYSIQPSVVDEHIYLPLSPQQCLKLRSKFHIYLPENGRINIAGLNSSNMDLVDQRSTRW
ncbi:PLP-dependent transferase [Zopfia rhizophila CBS 207.26]|uniref:PLP-dependent transferase n=1 Tax=Zopfia rhizophila CBS 207.26 TaxID=1314779 RepID=A0A6A6EQ24_9PEZI|nr:PLP-dependent transferase [Zopfia rhizophila CBS 207.26]